MSDKLRIGICGLNRGRVHIKNSIAADNIELVAVCDINREKADLRAAEYGVKKVYYDHRELCVDPDIDAVIMATPIDVHAETVIDALDAGKHVMSEVIVATTLEDIGRIRDAIKRSGKTYMMLENYCYIRPLLIIENLVRQGKFGEIYYAESDYLKDFQEYNPNFPNIGGWRQKTYFGRRGHPYITHTLGPLLNIMKERVKTVTCMAAGHSFDMVADNTAGLMLETDGGHLICLRSSFVSPRPDSVTYYSFEGTLGTYQAPQGPADYHKVYIDGVCRRGSWNAPGEWKNVYEFIGDRPKCWDKYWNAADYPATLLDNDTYELYDSGALMMLEHFADALLNGKEAPVSFADAANWTAAGLLSADSVNRGCVPIAVPDFSL
ncbi:MAG: Gfo/Idh/MocA family oxidoreductase [Clostridiales bacterium]|nr:Gfo/Idh/MocA family oxidoreductase [Clostridiales bacterium]